MNPSTILMCWNIPKIEEEVLYELYCIAGPIEDISFSSSGKSCFIIYEHGEAVATAKDIFEGLKLNGRIIHMFDQKDIEEIYKQQEQQIENRKRRLETENQDISYERRSQFEQPRSFNDQFYQNPYGMNLSPPFNRVNAQTFTDYRVGRDSRSQNRFYQGPHGMTNFSPSFNRDNAQTFPDYRVDRDNRSENQYHSNRSQNQYHSNRSQNQYHNNRSQNQYHSSSYESNHPNQSDFRHVSESRTRYNDSCNIVKRKRIK